MATLIWTESAVADLEEIGQFISKDNPPAAEKVGSNIIREERRRRIAEWI
jgi:plasmid stabilization system protein ParE